MQHKRFVADLYGVTGVVSPLIPGHDVEMLGEEIDDLAFAFIAPLGAYDNNDLDMIKTGLRSLVFGL